MASGNPKGNSNLILPLQKRLAGQLCYQISNQNCRFYYFNIVEAVIVLGLGELFRRLFCCSLEEYRVIHARPHKVRVLHDPK